MGRTITFIFFLAACLPLLSACATLPGAIPASGPSREQTLSLANNTAQGINVVPATDSVARMLAQRKKATNFADLFPGTNTPSLRVGAGDVLKVSLWEAPPATLFGSTALDPRTGLVVTSAVSFPDQMVMDDGQITIPFAGLIQVAGKTTRTIEAEIERRLTGKANQPQVLVQISTNRSANVTVVGEVKQSMHLELTPKRERLLDALAGAGGVTQPVTKMSVQISRATTTGAMPLDTIIRNPKQNITLHPGDVVTALYQPKSFTVFGATGQNNEIPFEANGITLAQALARSGGLVDNRADARGIFVFRFEQQVQAATSVAPGGITLLTPALQSGVPTVYVVNLRDPASFFVSQNFPMEDKDIIYVANAPAAELQKFLQMLGLVINPTINTTRFMQAM